MKFRNTFRRPVLMALGLVFAVSSAQAAVIGDVKDTKKGMKQAINCHYDKAIERLDTAIAGGGFAAELAVLEKVAVMLDAGYEEEAMNLLDERNESVGASEEDIAEAEESVKQTVEALRDEREKQTGSRTCP